MFLVRDINSAKIIYKLVNHFHFQSMPQFRMHRIYMGIPLEPIIYNLHVIYYPVTLNNSTNKIIRVGIYVTCSGWWDQQERIVTVVLH